MQTLQISAVLLFMIKKPEYYSKKCALALSDLKFPVREQSLGTKLLSMVASALCLVSLFFPWWGISTGGFGYTHNSWGPWSFVGYSTGADYSQTSLFLIQTSPFILIMVLVTFLVTVFGSLASDDRYNKVGFPFAIVTALIYTGIVSYAASFLCRGTFSCTSGPVGSSVAPNVYSSWGFEIGFYIFLAAAFTLLGAMILQRALVRNALVDTRRGLRNAIQSLLADTELC